MPNKEKKLYTIVCSHPGAPKNACQMFQVNDNTFYVPFNKAVEVPLWVYKLWKDSMYNPERSVREGVDPEHLDPGQDPGF